MEVIQAVAQVAGVALILETVDHLEEGAVSPRPQRGDCSLMVE
jgi:hypothetical protein